LFVGQFRAVFRDCLVQRPDPSGASLCPKSSRWSFSRRIGVPADAILLGPQEPGLGPGILQRLRSPRYWGRERTSLDRGWIEMNRDRDYPSGCQIGSYRQKPCDSVSEL
jgi:hypothetical protein